MCQIKRWTYFQYFTKHTLTKCNLHLDSFIAELFFLFLKLCWYNVLFCNRIHAKSLSPFKKVKLTCHSDCQRVLLEHNFLKLMYLIIIDY